MPLRAKLGFSSECNCETVSSISLQSAGSLPGIPTNSKDTSKTSTKVIVHNVIIFFTNHYRLSDIVIRLHLMSIMERIRLLISWSWITFYLSVQWPSNIPRTSPHPPLSLWVYYDLVLCRPTSRTAHSVCSSMTIVQQWLDCVLQYDHSTAVIGRCVAVWP